MPRRSPIPLLALTLAASLALLRPARAQDVAAAEKLFDRGLADMEAGLYETGCRALGESHRLDPRPGTLFTLAMCEERWGHIATAVTRYGDYLGVFDRLPEDRRATQGQRPTIARTRRAKLAPEVPELTLVLPPGAPPGTAVKRDGQVLAAAALGMGLPVDPGEHLVSTDTPGGGTWELRFTLARGEKKTVGLEVRHGGARSSASAPPAGSSSLQVAGWTTGGVGLAGVAAGAILGGLALGRKATVSAHCGGDPKDPKGCDQDGLDAVGAVKGLGAGSTVAFSVGLAGVTTGAVLLLVGRRKPTPATGLRLEPGLVAAGPGGFALGVRGGF